MYLIQTNWYLLTYSLYGNADVDTFFSCYKLAKYMEKRAITLVKYSYLSA